MDSDNKLITIEGPDSVGKATQARLLADALSGTVVSFPQYGTPQGKLLKKLLTPTAGLGVELDDMDQKLALQGAMLWDKYSAYDVLHRAEVGASWVITDRYWMSACVYGAMDGLDMDTLCNAHFGLPKPAIAIYLKVSPEIQLERLRLRGRAPDRYESKVETLRNTHYGYDQLWKRFSSMTVKLPSTWWITVDGEGTQEEVFHRIHELVRHHITTA